MVIFGKNKILYAQINVEMINNVIIVIRKVFVIKNNLKILCQFKYLRRIFTLKEFYNLVHLFIHFVLLVIVPQTVLLVKGEEVALQEMLLIIVHVL
jgi:hypothetical protein